MKNSIYRLIMYGVLASFLPINFARANSDAGCGTLPVSASIRQLHGRQSLELRMENQTTESVEFFKFAFGTNMLKLRANRSSNGKDLAQIVPLIGPGLENVVIRPGDGFSESIDLDGVFPELRSALAETDVVISWELQLKPINACFSQVVSTSMTLKRNIGKAPHKPAN